MTTTEAYVVTDLHPPTRNRWPTRERAWRFAKADAVALWMVTRFCGRHLGQVLRAPVRSDGMPLWFALIGLGIAAWIVAGIASHPDVFTCPEVHDSQSAAQPAPSYC